MPEASPKGITKVVMTDVDGVPVAGGSGGGPASIADGLDVAQGTTTDVAWVSGAGTVISLLKKIASAGGSAVSIADGADVVEGLLADAKVVGDTAGTISAKLRGINTALAGTLTVGTHAVTGPLTDAQLRASAVPVSGTFWQATQPVSIAAAVDVSDRAGRLLGVVDKGKIWDGTNIAAVTGANALKVDGSAVTQPVSGTFWQATQPVSIAAAVDVSDRAGRLLGVVDKGKIWDGTNIAAVKAGVVAVAGDNPLVVTLHPSSAPTAAQPVTGTFWQATQPVSGTVATTVADGANVTQGAVGDAAWVSGNGTVISLLKKIASAGGSAVSIADGADVAEGTIADAKVVGDTAGTISAKLRGINTALAGTIAVSLASVPSHAVTNAGTFAVQDSDKLVDNAPFTDGTTKVMPTGLIFDEVAGTALTENDIGAARMDSKRAAVFTLEDFTTRGQRLTITAANAAKVDGSAVTQPVSIAATVTADVSDRAGRLLGIVDKGKIWDGTNIAAVKAASTAAVATDPALVVAVSPNNSVAVTGTFWQATQPVSLGAAVDVSDRAGRLLGVVDKGKIWDGTNIAAVKAASTAAVATDPALVVAVSPNNSVAVTGTFFQGTQPVSLAAAVDVSDRAGRLLGIVDKGKIWDGTNTAAVKAASTAAVAADPALVVAISPNNTVPVSGPLTDAQLRASVVPVSLTSTTITGSVAVTGPLTDAQLRASAVPVDVSDRAARLLGVIDKGKIWDGTNIAAVTAGLALKVDGSAVTQPVSGPLTDTQLRATAVPTADTNVRGLLEQILIEDQQINLNTADPKFIPKPDPGVTGSVRSVSSVTTNQMIAPGLVNRAGLTIYNNSTATLYVLLAPGIASITFFSVQLAPGAYYELPQGVGGCYKGPVTGAWSTANGTALVTEWTT